MQSNISEKVLERFCRVFEIQDTGLTKVRVGRQQDGGYIVLDEVSRKTDVLFSYGIADDVSFELDFVEKYPNCQRVLLFDHTIDALPATHEKFTFVKDGVAAHRTDDCGTLNDHNIIACPADHTTLKMDIEWGEWDVFDYTSLGCYDQIICEFHVVPVEFRPERETAYFTKFYKSVYDRVNDELFTKYTNVMEDVLETHVIAHIHANNSLRPNIFGEYSIPPLLEVTLVHRSECTKLKPFMGVLPIDGLDFPNKPYKAEIRNFYPFK